ncbi:MAG: hypothetical protein ABGZ53_03200 [Fuerstiella sp.]
MTSRITFFLLLVVCSGCLPVEEDSWQHYQSGGHYPARTPAMAPDGSVIVFSSPRTGNGDIYQINRDGTQLVRLTDSSAFETDPIFSSDGSIIAFAREADGRRHIWLMDRDGSKQRQLTSGRVLDDPWAFSPDGSELILQRSPLSMGMGRSVTSYAANPRSKQIRTLEASPVYSPDGARVAYGQYNEPNKIFEIWIADADGSNKRLLVSGHSPRFSPDGNTILYSTENSDPGSLWKMIDIDGSNSRELGRVEGPVFAPDGKHVLCLSPEWQREIWKLEFDGSNRKRLQAPTGYIDFFRPCRDGFIIKLVTDDRVGDIYVVDTDEWNVERVASMR